MTKANGSEDESAARVWSALQAFVEGHHPRKELQEILGLGRGLGRVKTILLLVKGPATLRAIAEYLGVDAPYATVIVNKLEDVGFVGANRPPRRRPTQTRPAHSRGQGGRAIGRSDLRETTHGSHITAAR